MERWSCYGGGQFNGGRIYVMEVASLIEGEVMVMLHVTGRLMEGKWSCYFNGGRMVMLQR